MKFWSLFEEKIAVSQESMFKCLKTLMINPKEQEQKKFKKYDQSKEDKWFDGVNKKMELILSKKLQDNLKIFLDLYTSNKWLQRLFPLKKMELTLYGQALQNYAKLCKMKN